MMRPLNKLLSQLGNTSGPCTDTAGPFTELVINVEEIIAKQNYLQSNLMQQAHDDQCMTAHCALI